MANYDPQSLESVLLYMRQRFGASVFRDANRAYAILSDLSPKLKPYGNILRQLIERGTLSELETASGGDKTQGERVIMKARHTLENELFLRPDLVELFTGVLRTLYGLAAPKPVAPPTPQAKPTQPVARPAPQAQPVARPAPQAKPTPQAQPGPTPSARIVKRGACGDKVTYTLDANGLLTVSGSGPMRNYDMNVSTSVVDTPWWDERKAIRQVNIQGGVTVIGYRAFQGCANLSGVVISNGVRTIGHSAFWRCASLTSVAIPDSVKTIGVWTFADCKALTSVAIPEGVERIDNRAFMDCAGLKSVTIPDSVKTIGDEAFAGCKALTGVSVPGGASLASDAFPKQVRVTRRGAAPPQAQPGPTPSARIVKRGACGDKVTYTLDENGLLTVSGYGPMRNYDMDGVGVVDTPWWDERKAIRQVNIQGGVTSVGDRAFQSCESIRGVTIPGSVTTIGHSSFWRCVALTSVTIPDSVKVIRFWSFADCKALTGVTIPEGVATIEDSAFLRCAALKSVTIPDSVTTIEAKAFEDCKALTGVSVPGKTNVLPKAFPDYVRVTRRGAAPTRAQAAPPTPSAPIVKRGQCGDKVTYTLDENGLLTISGSGPMRDYDMYSLDAVNTPWWDERDAIRKVSIQRGVTIIGARAFQNCASLTDAVIPESVTSIGHSAFWYCAALTGVTIPNSVTTIQGWAFADCAKLTGVTIPDSVKVIEQDAFRDCANLKTASVPAHTKISHGPFGTERAFPKHVRVTRRG